MQEYSAISPQFHNLTYPRLRLNDHTLDNLPGFQSQPGGNRLRPPPETCAGALDALPPELIVKILSQLDLRTLEHFRCVNRRAWNSLTSLPSTKPLSHMRTMPCEAFQASKLVVGLPAARYMRNYGGYLYLFTCKRVCFLSLSQDKLYLPLPRRRVSRIFGLDCTMLEKLPHLRVIPGIYSPNEKKAAQFILVDYESALCAGVAFHGSFNAMKNYVSHKEVQKVKGALKSGYISHAVYGNLS
ncbi:hypothetical protein ACHAPX_002620 [Trichoderma viride]